MTHVLVAFSGGLDSTYLIHEKLNKGHTVIPCYLNNWGSNRKHVAEFIARDNIINLFREKIKSRVYKGQFGRIVHYNYPPIISPSDKQGVEANNINQQANAILMMMAIRRVFIEYAPTILVGWLKEDTREESFHHFDYSAKQYQQLLDLPETFGPISGITHTGHCTAFAPLWDKSKIEIWNGLPEDLRNLLVYNGESVIVDDVVRQIHSQEKRDEYKTIGVDIGETKSYRLEDLTFESKYSIGCLTLNDLHLDQKYKPEYHKSLNAFIQRISEHSRIMQDKVIVNEKFPGASYFKESPSPFSAYLETSILEVFGDQVLNQQTEEKENQHGAGI